MLGHLVPTEDN